MLLLASLFLLMHMAIATGVPAAIDCPLFLVFLLLLASLSVNNTPAVASAAVAVACP
jgi:hypothetical protein